MVLIERLLFSTDSERFTAYRVRQYGRLVFTLRVDYWPESH